MYNRVEKILGFRWLRFVENEWKGEGRWLRCADDRMAMGESGGVGSFGRYWAWLDLARFGALWQGLARVGGGMESIRRFVHRGCGGKVVFARDTLESVCGLHRGFRSAVEMGSGAKVFSAWPPLSGLSGCIRAASGRNVKGEVWHLIG